MKNTILWPYNHFFPFSRLKGDTFLAGGSPLPGLKVLANNTLWIQSMDHPLSGIYSCVAVSPDAETITAKAYVLVKNTAHDDVTCGIGKNFKSFSRNTVLDICNPKISYSKSYQHYAPY